MYSSRGNNAYSQQSYAGQSAYGQNLGSAYSGSSVGGPDVGSQLSMASRHSSIIGSQEASGGGYRAHPSGAAQYGGQYSSVYGSAALSGASQVPAITAKAGVSSLEGRAGYTSVITDSPKFSSVDYVSSSSHGYNHKADKLYSGKVPDYPVIDRRQYSDQQSAYVGRDLHADPTGRYTDSVGFVSQHQSDIYDRIDQAVLLRQEQLLKAQSLQSASLDSSARQVDYLAARGASSRHSTQELVSLGGRTDADPHGLSMLSASSYNGQHTPSILGAAPRKTVDDLMYAQNSSNPGYGVSLPPGRDYATGKGLHGSSLDEDYQGSLLPRAGHSRIDERKDDKASYLREFELREEERRRERLRVREKDREREKERERDRERERERERERQHIMERREKKREREGKRSVEIKHGRTPTRVSRDRRGSSLTKEGGRLLRRDSPHREYLHRRHSPVKEKRREYVCKVYTSSVIDVERAYLSIDKRYPRLFISPEFSKVVVNWPKENIKLSLQTPVSFEHDFVEEEGATELKKSSTELLSKERSKGHGNTVWNAKIVLMSGISKNALEELSSEKKYDDRIPHICNILRFSLLKKGHSYMAIGGPWDPVDGADPSIDDSSLIRTVQRYAKDVAKLDLQNCQHWNRFLEIHYDRFGKDGLFSHKERTVVFVPDLSECLPSLDAWRDQWLAFKKDVAERDELSKKKERLREKEALKDKVDSSKDVKRLEKKKEPASSGKVKDIDKKERDDRGLEGNVVDGKGTADEMDPKEKDVNGASKLGKNENQKQEKTVGTPTAGSVKAGKKKVIKKVVKQKVAGKITGETTAKQLNEKENGEKKIAESDASAPQAEASVDPSLVQTLKKKVTKKVGTASESKKDAQLETAIEKPDGSEDKPKDTSDPSLGGVVQDIVKSTIKKKIIKRIPKKKATGTESSNVPFDNKKDGDGKNGVPGSEAESTGKQAADVENIVNEVKSTDKKISQKKSSKTQVSEMQDTTELKDETLEKKDAKSANDRGGSGTREGVNPDKCKPLQEDNLEGKQQKLKDSGKPKDEKERKGKDGKDESRNKSSKDKEKNPEEPPRHPGLFLQTRSKDCKLRSASFSLDSLLDYSDKDIEESTFELSLFAETLYEMLQYQMGCRILSFLQKLRVRFVRKRSQRKRQHEERNEAENVKVSPSKRLKTEEFPVKNQSSQASEMLSELQPDNENKDEENNMIEDHNSTEHIDEEMEHETDEEDDSEEDPEEYEEVEDASHQRDSSVENIEDGKSTMHVKPKNDSDEVDKSVEEQPEMKASEANAIVEVNTHGNKDVNMDTSKNESAKEAIIDKELLQAFRFFDRNRIGYIRVEDMRLIIHNLGKFLSHRDVKELVQSALLESNTGRDDRILYYKLVRMIDI